MKASAQKTNGRRHFTYRGEERTAEDVSRAAKTSGGSFDQYLTQGVNFYKPREGENTIRILPFSWEDTKKWGKDWAILIYVHHSIGADNSAYLCLEKMKGEECPICAARADSDDEEEQRALRPNKRALVWLIDRDNEKAGPHVWSMPLQLYRDLQLRSMDKKTSALLLLDHPEEGYDITFIKEGTGLHTKYTGVEVARETSAISDNEKKQTRWLDAIAEQPLPEILNYYEAEYIEKILAGKSAKRSSDDDDDEDKPTRRKSTKRPKANDDDDEDEDKPARGRGKGKAKDDDDEEEVDADEETEDEDEADEKAHRRNKRSVARDEDEEEGEAEEESDDDSDDEEEEAKPSRRRPSKAKDDDDEEADDEDESEADDDDDDDEPKAKKGKGKSSKRAAARDDDDEEEESDDDEGDEDEDEKPKSKAGTASSRARAKLDALKKRRKK